jgi:hypothetical protein
MILVFGRGYRTVAAVLGITMPSKFALQINDPQLEKTDPSHKFKVHIDQILNLFIPVVQ